MSWDRLSSFFAFLNSSFPLIFIYSVFLSCLGKRIVYIATMCFYSCQFETIDDGVLSKTAEQLVEAIEKSNARPMVTGKALHREEKYDVIF